VPFADAVSGDLPLSRLARLSLFQISVGMALVLLNGTLNRVMVLEMGLPAWLVASDGLPAAAVRTGCGR
jgi:BCD family chlorophyll transporter-like MFS transporter